ELDFQPVARTADDARASPVQSETSPRHGHPLAENLRLAFDDRTMLGRAALERRVDSAPGARLRILWRLNTPIEIPRAEVRSLDAPEFDTLVAIDLIQSLPLCLVDTHRLAFEIA